MNGRRGPPFPSFKKKRELARMFGLYFGLKLVHANSCMRLVTWASTLAHMEASEWGMVGGLPPPHFNIFFIVIYLELADHEGWVTSTKYFTYLGAHVWRRGWRQWMLSRSLWMVVGVWLALIECVGSSPAVQLQIKSFKLIVTLSASSVLVAPQGLGSGYK